MPKEREIDDMVPKVSPQTTESMTETKSGSDIEKIAALIKTTELGVKMGMGTGTEIGMGTGTEIGMGVEIKSELEMGIKTNGEMKTDTSIIIESLDLSIPGTQDVHDPSKVNKL